MRSVDSELSQLADDGLTRQLRKISTVHPNQSIDLLGASLINFSSNDYLGFAQLNELKTAFAEAIQTHGVGSGASRLVSGTRQPHLQLEEKLASFKQTEAALTFSSGYAVATGLIPALMTKGDIIIMDKLCHASLIDGAKLSGAKLRIFAHNDTDVLKSHLQWADNQRSKGTRILVMTESVFSMDGDLAPLREIVELKEKYGALLLVDEAHAIGVMGPSGRGLGAELAIDQLIDLHVGTLSKAVGLSGGYVCATRQIVDLLINKARSFIYSTAPPPALAQTAITAIDLIQKRDDLRDQLSQHIAIFCEEARLPQSSSAIIPVLLGSNESALSLSEKLQSSGFLVPAIRYPTVPRNSARLRITLSAAHQEADVRSLARQVLDATEAF